MGKADWWVKNWKVAIALVVAIALIGAAVEQCSNQRRVQNPASREIKK